METYNGAGAAVMASKTREFINRIRDMRDNIPESETLEERDLYNVREGYRLGLAAAALMLAEEHDAIAGEGSSDGEEAVWWSDIDGDESNPGTDERLETAAGTVERKDANKSRNRWYGLRIGDVVTYRYSIDDEDDTLYEVIGYMRSDNNAVILRSEDGVVDKHVAEWCRIVERVDDRPLDALAWI